MPRSLQKLGKRQDWTERRRLRSRLRRGTPPRILPVSKVRLCPRLTLFCPASPPRSNLPSSPPSLPLGALLHSSRPLPPCSSHLPVAPRCRKQRCVLPPPNPPLPCLASPGPIFLSLRPRFLSAPFSAVSAPRARYLAPCCSHLPVRSSTLLQHREAKQEESQRDCSERLAATREWHPLHPAPRVPLSLLAYYTHSHFLLTCFHPSLAPHFPTVAPRFPLSLTASFLASQPQNWCSLPPGLAPRFMPSSPLLLSDISLHKNTQCMGM